MSAQPEVEVDLVRRRFTVEEYERMGQTGILGEDDRVELLDGEIIQMAPIGPTHAGAVNRLNRLLVRGVGDRAIVTVQNPVRLTLRSEPQPDLVVARPRSDDYMLGHPVPEDVLLLIEVAHSSLATDRAIKIPLYARAGIVEAWLVDLEARVIIVHREPQADRYRDVRTARLGDEITLSALPDVTIAVTDVLGQ